MNVVCPYLGGSENLLLFQRLPCITHQVSHLKLPLTTILTLRPIGSMNKTSAVIWFHIYTYIVEAFSISKIFWPRHDDEETNTDIVRLVAIHIMYVHAIARRCTAF